MAIAVRGSVAETTVTARFANPTARLALPAGSVVTGYAIDVGDQMIAGVLLDRQQR